jgi:hypothetical protein
VQPKLLMSLLIRLPDRQWCQKAERVYHAAIRHATAAPRRPHKRMSQPAFQSEPHPQNAHIQEIEAQTPEEKADESRRIRRLQLMMNMVMQVIQQDRSLPVEQASEMVADARRAALAMFPDKALAFDLIFWPRLQRLMRERYRMQ